MACGGSGQSRAMLGRAIASGSPRGVYQAVSMGVAVNWQKMTGTYNEANYTSSGVPVRDAKPYQRPAERTR